VRQDCMPGATSEDWRTGKRTCWTEHDVHGSPLLRTQDLISFSTTCTNETLYQVVASPPSILLRFWPTR
jgi:hypothetical protein